ncbi:MAG: ATP-binding protein [Planctomycetota bacterium]|nr:ATP-binding protein [Planctomycetota bacterium]
MSSRVSALSNILRSPLRILTLVLLLVFTAEVAVMLVLPFITPNVIGEGVRAVLDAFLLTMVCAPVLWWVIIGPLRRIAIQEHQRSETIVANASESILTFDRFGTILSCNRSTLELFQGSAEQLIGNPIQSIIPDLPVTFATFPLAFRLSAVRSNREFFPVQISVSEYPSESQNVRIAILRDLTWSERAEQERLERARETEALRTQQMATLAQLATGVAHEIRNPLTSIKMLIQVNLASFAKTGLPTDDLELVEQEIRRMERSVNSLLDYARPEKSEFAAFSIQSVLRRTSQLVSGRCQSQNVQLSINVPTDSLTLVGDSAQIQQLLLNLSLNALDVMPDGGKLEIAVLPKESTIRIAVRDTGPGIESSMLPQLFTPFATTKPNGVGLGLGICRRIAEAHHGTLSGTNSPNGGAEFLLTLPIALPDTSIITKKSNLE